MTAALSALVILGLLGAFDTLYYHEWRLRLPETRSAAPELRLHAIRDFAYTIVFGSLAWTTWNGNWIWPFAAVLLFEIWVTLTDFVEEDAPAASPPASASCTQLWALRMAFFSPYCIRRLRPGGRWIPDSAPPTTALSP
jgi:hypothetical protein